MCMMSTPDMPVVPPPEPPPAAAKAPDQAVFRNRNQAASMAANKGNQSTMLSGAGGVATDSLNLGKHSLLGQ